MVSFLGRLGSKVIIFPLSLRFCCAASALVMALLVALTYSLVAVREGSGGGTSGQRAFWMVEGEVLLRTSDQM